jgi:diadenosine tetraphosphate (Ap4A) HIT family hydrolase
MSVFQLDPRLDADTAPVMTLGLSRVLLMNDARFPWLILVPQRAGAVEIFDLDPADQTRLMAEAAQIGAALKGVTGARKINIAALGNMVPQLHVHVIARFDADAAWPAPVWVAGAAKPRTPDALHAEAARLATALAQRL